MGVWERDCHHLGFWWVDGWVEEKAIFLPKLLTLLVGWPVLDETELLEIDHKLCYEASQYEYLWLPSYEKKAVFGVVELCGAGNIIQWNYQHFCSTTMGNLNCWSIGSLKSPSTCMGAMETMESPLSKCSLATRGEVKVGKWIWEVYNQLADQLGLGLPEAILRLLPTLHVFYWWFLFFKQRRTNDLNFKIFIFVWNKWLGSVWASTAFQKSCNTMFAAAILWNAELLPNPNQQLEISNTL